MFRSLRLRLLISHILPIFLLIPLIGIALMSLLEARVILPSLANEMSDQALILARLAEASPNIWTDSTAASNFLAGISLQQQTSISLIGTDQTLIAVNQPQEQSQVGMAALDLPPLLPSQSSVRTEISPGSFGSKPVLDILAPVAGQNGQTSGYIRLYRRLQDVSQGLQSGRILIFWVLLGGLGISILIGLSLAESMGRPLQKVAKAIADAPLEGEARPMPVSGINEIQSITNSFNRLQERRIELESSRKMMMANLIHELGRPLGSLQAALHALLSGAETNISLRHDLLVGMEERVSLLGRLIDDLTAWSMGGLKTNRFLLKVFPVQPWLGKLIPVWQETAKIRKIQLFSEIRNGLPQLYGDEDRLAEALGNLVNNAFKYTAENGSVWVRAGCDDENVWFQVQDTGLGIAPTDQEKVFEPFFRSVSPSWKAPGLGLGLSITRTIVEAHRGKITLQSEPGKGSTFTIYLPMALQNTNLTP